MSSAASLVEPLLRLFADAGFARADTDILQPASLFVDLSGEDIRRRLFLTDDAEGAEWCLRPEFTIPLARDHLTSARNGRAELAYAGPVFRHRTAEKGEFMQAGVESFGRKDHEAADAEMLALAREACAAAGLAAPSIVVGDAGLFNDLIAGLDLGASDLRRLRKAFANGKLAEAIAERTQADAPGDEYAGLLSAIEGQDPKAARAFIEDILKIAGIEQVGGRSAGMIADRFLRQASARGGSRFDARSRAILAEFAAIAADPDAALLALRGFAARHGLKLDVALKRFETRNGFLAARGVDPAELEFRALFGRNLDYYTGFVFEIRDPARADDKPVCGGGRYDGLMAALGAGAPLPAVGFSMWLDRLAGNAP